MRRVLARVVLALSLLVALPPVALGAAPAGMAVSGTVRVNEAIPPAGTLVSAFAGENGPLAQGATTDAGEFSLVVPADDPATAPREGARPGEALRFVVLGGSQGGPAFTSGANVSLDLAYALPQLRVQLAGIAPDQPREGAPVVVSLVISNQGSVVAQAPAIALLESGRIVGSNGTSDLAAGASREVNVTASTLGISGDVTLVATATARNGEADPSANRATVSFHVAPDDAPVIASFSITPATPHGGEVVSAEVVASDADGIASVRFEWRAPDGHHEKNVTAPPFRAQLDAFAVGDSIEVWATVKDAGPTGKTNTTEHRTIIVQQVEAPTRSSPPPRGLPAPGLPLAVAAIVASLMLRRAKGQS